MEYQRVLLKLSAKRAMKQTQASPMLTTLLFLVVAGVVSWLISVLLNLTSGMSEISLWLMTELSNEEHIVSLFKYLVWSVGWGRLILTFLVGGLVSMLVRYLWQSVTDAGYRNFCLSIVRGQTPTMGSVFGGFSHLGLILPTRLLTFIFASLWEILFTAVLLLVTLVTIGLLFNVSAVLCVLLLVVAAVAYVIAIMWVELRYAMVNFLIMDQGMTGLAAIRESKRLMQGNKVKLFCLHLSFIGWYFAAIGIFYALFLVVVIPMGIGMGVSSMYGRMDGMVGAVVVMIVLFLLYIIGVFIMTLWLKPYITGCEALFYEWARGAGPIGAVPVGPAPMGPAPGGWGAPGPQGQNYNYTWTDGPGGSGSGIGGGAWPGGPQAPSPYGRPQSGGPDSSTVDPASGVNWGGSGSPTKGPESGSGWGPKDGSAPKPPRDDPWA